MVLHCILFAPAVVAPGSVQRAWYGAGVGHLAQLLGTMLYIFFVLSGYLIARPFVRWVIFGGPRPGAKKYARNRALRILPMFWFACLVALVFHGVHNNSGREVLALFGLGQVFAHGETGSPTVYVGQGWTISVEVCFYIAVPLVALALAWALGGRGTFRSRATAVLAFTAAVFAVSLWTREPGSSAWNLRLPHEVLFAFMPGIALAAVEPFAAPLLARRRPRIAVVVPSLMLVAGVAVMYGMTFTTDPRVYAVRVAAGSGLIVCAALGRQWARGDSWRALDNRVLHWVGERSLSIYILHGLVQDVVFTVARRNDLAPGSRSLALLIVADVGLTLAASSLTYRFIEAPAMSLRKRGTLQPVVPAPVAI